MLDNSKVYVIDMTIIATKWNQQNHLTQECNKPNKPENLTSKPETIKEERRKITPIIHVV